MFARTLDCRHDLAGDQLLIQTKKTCDPLEAMKVHAFEIVGFNEPQSHSAGRHVRDGRNDIVGW